MVKKRKEQDMEHGDDVEIVEEGDEVSTFKQKKVSSVVKELKDMQKQAQEYLTGWQRAQADLINFKKSAQEEESQARTRGKEVVIGDMLPILDSFEMAFANTDAWEQVDTNWRTGVEYIYTQLKNALEGHGVAEINPVGQPFDPLQHTSVETVAVESEAQDGIVVSVLQKGYSIGDKAVRAARVTVGEYNTK